MAGQPAGWRVALARRAELDELHRLEVAAVGLVHARRLDDRQPPVLVELEQRRGTRVQPELAGERQRGVGPAERHRQLRPGRLVVAAVAAAGLLVNVIAFAVLHGGDRDNLNIRGAALHVAGDLLGSVAAIVAAIVIIYTGWMAIDPLLSIAVAFLILKSAWALVQQSGHVLLEGAPAWLDREEMQRTIIEHVPEVSGIHHVHIWGLTPQDLMLTMHVTIAPDVSDLTAVVRRVKATLKDDYGIGHSTIEIETADCADH